MCRGFTYYKMSNLDNRISNADQLLTNDIDKFCESVTDFYSNASKPLLDIIIYMYRLTITIGAKVMWKTMSELAVGWHFNLAFIIRISTDAIHIDALSVLFGSAVDASAKANR